MPALTINERGAADLTVRQLERAAAGKIHHRAVFYLFNGTTKEGYLQPWDDKKVYLTTLEGKSGGNILISEIQRISFPDDGEDCDPDDGGGG